MQASIIRGAWESGGLLHIPEKHGLWPAKMRTVYVFFCAGIGTKGTLTSQKERIIIPVKFGLFGKEGEILDIHTRQLRYFLELSQCLNFTKAALNLYIAQPALSQQIAELEKQLGVSLFVRNSRSVSLTPAGKLLQEACPDILARLERVQQDILLAQAGRSGCLRIGYLDAFQATLPTIVQQFSRQYPGVALEFSTGTPKMLRTALKNGEIDVAFLYMNDRVAPETDAPSYHVLWREDLCLAVHEDHPFAASGCTDYGLLKQDTIYLVDEKTAPRFHLAARKTCGDLGLRPEKMVTTSEVGSIMIRVEAGLGISLLSAGERSFTYAPFRHVKFIPIEKGIVDFGVSWYSNSQNAALPLFLDMLEVSVHGK